MKEKVGTIMVDTELQHILDGIVFRVILRLTNIGNTDEVWLEKHPDGEYFEWDFDNHDEALVFQDDLKKKWKLV